MTGRRTFLTAVGASLLAPPLRAADGRRSGLPRIGLLSPGVGNIEAALMEGMREQGYVEGRNVLIERRSDSELTRLPALADELVKLRPDIIVTIVTAASIAASKATTVIPIVFVAVGDPVVAGLVGNLSRPGGNVTGTASQTNATVGKTLELVRQVLPGAKRIAILWNPANAMFQQMMLGEGLIAATRLRLSARIFEARVPDDLPVVFDAIAADRPDALLVSQDPMFNTHGKRAADLALARRLPAFGGQRSLTESGALLSYGANLYAISRRSAMYVRKILNGAKPGDLAVELPTKFELVINAKTAQALGVTVPPAVIAQADDVIH